MVPAPATRTNANLLQMARSTTLKFDEIQLFAIVLNYQLLKNQLQLRTVAVTCHTLRHIIINQ